MAKILKFNEYIAEGANQIKLAYTQKQIIEMARQAIVSAEKMEHTSMFPIYGEMDNPSVYLAVGYEKEYANGVLCWFAFPKNVDEKIKNIFVNAMKSVAKESYIEKDGITNGTLEKILNRIIGKDKGKKIYRITKTKSRMFGNDSVYTKEGTLEELVKYYKGTLETGKSYEHESGNKKINTNPKNIESLVKNLYNASNNAAANGYSGCYYEYEEI